MSRVYREMNAKEFVDTDKYNKCKVTIEVPEFVYTCEKKRKINKLYDILSEVKSADKQVDIAS